jgi:hypothetical protein
MGCLWVESTYRVGHVDTRRLRSVAMIAIFDIGGPLLAYHLLQSNGFSTVAALVLSGALPAVGMIIGFLGHRRVDAVGVLVLAGIAVGALLGLVSHNPKLVLDEGSVSTGVFGLICLGSLATDKPMMYRLALEFMGPDTRKGREFADLRQYKEFRRAFRVLTVVWGSAYVAEAAARVVIVQNTSAGTALAVSKVLPYAVAAVLIAWTVGYSRYQRRQGERLAAAYAAAAEVDGTAETGRTAENAQAAGTAETGRTAESAEAAEGTEASDSGAQADAGDGNLG